MEAAALHLSGLQFKVVPALLFSLCFISSAWLKSSNNQSVFLWSVLPTIPSIRLYFELWFSLWMGLFFPNGCWETHQLGEQGQHHKKIWLWGTHFKVSLGGSVCVYYLLYCSVCVWAVYSAGGKLCACVSLCLCVCTRKSQTEVDYCMCVSVSVCSLSILMLIIFVCAGASVVAVLPLSLVDSRGAAVFPLQISFLVSASSLSGR